MKFKQYINESFLPGDFIAQRRSSDTEYGIILGRLKNGSFKVVSIDIGRIKATVKSTKGWYPIPVRIKKREIPERLLDKIMIKAANMGWNDDYNKRKIKGIIK